jgi:hypothetical protein
LTFLITEEFLGAAGAASSHRIEDSWLHDYTGPQGADVDFVYREMGPEEQELDWRVTKSVLSDATLMGTLQNAQSAGQKHAVVALVEGGQLKEAYVSPETAVRTTYPFNAVDQAFEFYDPSNGVCLVIVRDCKVVISINGLIGRS